MMKSIRTLVRQDREKYVIPRRVQDVIPIQKIWEDGIFLTGGRYAKTFRFTDINYQVASEPDKEKMFRGYSAIINSLDCGATTKITIFNHRMSQINFEKSILMPMQWDGLDDYREEYNQMLLDKATNGNGIVQEKFITISVRKKDVDAARSFFARVEADLSSHFAALGSTCGPMNAIERLQILHRFYRSGEENEFRFSLRDSARKGHSFRDYICPDFIERHSDYLQIGDRFARVLYLKDYASYIQDDFVSELTDLNRDMMLSIDMVPIPTDEAVREVENRLLGVETNITNWQRRQNSNNNFSAVVPYDMELQRKESKEFLDDLTTRDQRMIFGILTMVITAGTKDQLDADTDAILSTARKRMCQMAILKYQQMDGLNTVLPIGTRKLNAFRTLTTESLAVFMPFKVQEIMDKGGMQGHYCSMKYALFVTVTAPRNPRCLRKTPVSRIPRERFSEIARKYAADLREKLPPSARENMQQTAPRQNPASLPHSRRRKKPLRRILLVGKSSRRRRNWASSVLTFPNRWKPLRQVPVLQKRLTPP